MFVMVIVQCDQTSFIPKIIPDSTIANSFCFRDLTPMQPYFRSKLDAFDAK